MNGRSRRWRGSGGPLQGRRDLWRGDALLAAVERYIALPQEAVLDLFGRASSYASGRRVTVEGITGVTAGLDAAGYLRFRADDGTMRVILAGGVRAIGA